MHDALLHPAYDATTLGPPHLLPSGCSYVAAKMHDTGCAACWSRQSTQTLLSGVRSVQGSLIMG